MGHLAAPNAARLLVLSQALFASCSGGSTTPEPTPTPIPNLAGTWEGTLTEPSGDRRTFAMTLTVTQAEGSSTLGGTLVTAYAGQQWLEPITSGTQDRFTVHVETERDISGPPSANAGFRYYDGFVNLAGTIMNGCGGFRTRGCDVSWVVNRRP